MAEISLGAFLLGLFTVLNVTDILREDTITQPLREFFGILHDSEGKKISIFREEGQWGKIKFFFARMLWCFRCTSWWVSLAVGLLYLLSPPLYLFLGFVSSLAWIAYLVDHLLKKTS